MDYKYLWDGTSLHWGLLKGDSEDDDRYLIVNFHTAMGLIIEDDELEAQIIKKMLSIGAKILSSSEYVEITRNTNIEQA